MNDPVQELCAVGQSHLTQMRYLDAEAALARAEAMALRAGDWDALARLYMPLQESRRQRRQRCGEGAIRMDLLADGPDRSPDPEAVVSQTPHGQLLVAGWASIAPAQRVRALAVEQSRYVETFLAAVYPLAGDTRCVVIVPTAEVLLPPAMPDDPIDRLLPLLPPFSIVLGLGELPPSRPSGDASTFAATMALWERLHKPFVTAGDQTVDPRRKIDAYRRAIEVDYACELAHQRISDAARALAGARSPA